MFTDRARRNQPYYKDFVEIDRSCRFTEINDNNSDTYLRQLIEYIQKYPKNLYAYSLAKDFILGLSYSVKNSGDSGISILGLQKIGPRAIQIFKFIVDSSFYPKDVASEKNLLKNAFQGIFELLGKGIGMQLEINNTETSNLEPLMEKLTINPF